ncbi:MAG: hypothetical protein GY774_08655 [Planctomycetes bacterium]|nr:hypothetical protein [Planctomycetota bacterium]
MNTIAFRHSLRGRMLLYLVLLMVVISVVVIAFRTVNLLKLNTNKNGGLSKK